MVTSTRQLSVTGTPRGIPGRRHVENRRPRREVADNAEPSGTSGLDAPTHRRHTRWFELGPGCFWRAALWGGGAALGGAAFGGLGLWALWRLRRALGVAGSARAMWRAYRRVRRMFTPRVGRMFTPRVGRMFTPRVGRGQRKTGTRRRR